MMNFGLLRLSEDFPCCDRVARGVGFPLALVLLATLNAAAGDIGDTTAAVQTMQEFLANPRAVAAKDGLVAIRYYNSGFGTRGDARLAYSKKRIPVSGIFSISKKLLPISTHEMFGTLPKADTAFKSYPVSNTDWRLLQITENGSSVLASEELINTLNKVFSSLGECSPCVVSFGDTAVVGNVELPSDGIAEGNVAILVREENGLKVRAIVHMQN
jgi:hypothetical protein